MARMLKLHNIPSSNFKYNLGMIPLDLQQKFSSLVLGERMTWLVVMAWLSTSREVGRYMGWGVYTSLGGFVQSRWSRQMHPSLYWRTAWFGTQFPSLPRKNNSFWPLYPLSLYDYYEMKRKCKFIRATLSTLITEQSQLSLYSHPDFSFSVNIYNCYGKMVAEHSLE